MDFSTKFNRVFGTLGQAYVDKASYIELVGSREGISERYRSVRAARYDAMRFAERKAHVDTVDISQPLAEVECWRPYGDGKYPFHPGHIVRVALPNHVFQDAFGLILWIRDIDTKFFVRVVKNGKTVIMVLAKNEMLPNIGMLSSKIMEKLNGKD